jgi:hypothetical protein
MQFTDKDKAAKAIGAFLVKLSECLPKETLRHLVYVKDQLDSEVFLNRSDSLVI